MMEKKGPLPEPILIPKNINPKYPFKAMGVHVHEQKKNDKFLVATAAEQELRQVSNTQTSSVTLYRKVNLVHYIQDPHTSTDKELMESAARRNFAVRVSLWIREQCAYRKSKLIIDLPEDSKIDLTADEIQIELDKYKKDTVAQGLLKKFRIRDRNLKVTKNAKTLAIQNWIFGRGLIIIYYKGETYSEITKLMSINTRRLGDPVLDETKDLSFEGCFVDGQALDKDSMIYATYFDRDISPHTESFGYSPTEPVIYIAQALNVLLEEDINEIVKSAWLPSILLPILTAGITGSNKQTQISKIIDNIDPAKILGIDAESLGGDAQMLDLKPDFTGINELADRLEEKIYNNYHIPLFLVKSDKIANLATAQKSAQLFIEGTVADDQSWMEEILSEQWYDPLLKEELKQTGLLKQTANPDATKSKIDTSAPKDAEAPLPFVIRRKFEKPRIEDLIEMAQVTVELMRDGIIDLQKAHELLNMEEITKRVTTVNDEQAKQDLEMKQQELDAKTQQLKTASASTESQSKTDLDIAKLNMQREILKRKNVLDMKKISDKIA